MVIPIYRYTQVDLLVENGTVVDVVVSVDNEPLIDYLAYNVIKIYRHPGYVPEKWHLTQKLITSSSWSDVEGTYEIASGTGDAPTLNILPPFTTVMYVLHIKAQ